MFSQVGKKPTRLLTVHLPSMRSAVRVHPHSSRCCRGHAHKALIGRSESGWNTAPAKQYPPRLCYFMANSIVSDVMHKIESKNEDIWIEDPK
eukprot:11512518-Karenia_brevis.AAC.1